MERFLNLEKNHQSFTKNIFFLFTFFTCIVMPLQALNLDFSGLKTLDKLNQLDDIKTVESSNIDSVSKIDLTLFKSKKPCYFYGESIIFLEENRKNKTTILSTIGTKNKNGEVVSYIEYKFKAKGFLDSKPKITMQEIVKQMISKKESCDFNSVDEIFKESKNFYQNLHGKHYYIKLIQ